MNMDEINNNSNVFEINGCEVIDIPTFYKEINRVFMSNENWKIAESLDAFDDLLYGGFGAIKNNETVKIVWKNFEQNRKILGKELTKQFYLKKLEQPEVFNTEFVKKQLDELLQGIGKTYFEIILEIIANHPNIHLVEKG